jgi:hypothetical protein
MTRVGTQGFAPIVWSQDYSAAHSDIGKQWLKLWILLILLSSILLKKYSTDFLASRAPFRATGRQLRESARMLRHNCPPTTRYHALILARTKRGYFVEHQTVPGD